MFTVLWDNDGVLVDTEGLYFHATREALTRVGIDLTPDHFREISLRRGESTFQLAAEQGIPNEEIANLRIERDRIHAESLRHPCVIEGVEEALRSLHGRVQMGIVTSRPTGKQHRTRREQHESNAGATLVTFLLPLRSQEIVKDLWSCSTSPLFTES